jgi:hypothetical protein
MWLVKAFVVALALAIAIPTYLKLDPSWRPLLVRLACAAVVAIGCSRLIGAARRARAGDPLSPLDAPPRRAPVPLLSERYLRLRDDIVFGSHRRGYFDVFLWPRLRKLGAVDPPPAERGRTRRGPSLAALSRVITDLETRP